MVNTKEEVAERKKSVLALYFMGNAPEKIAEKLAIPAKTVKRDLKVQGIRVLEDAKKDEEQILEEVHQELELIKQECWSMYTGTKNLDEKLRLISEIREILTRKAELVGFLEEAPLGTQNGGKTEDVWQEVKKAFLGEKKSEIPRSKSESSKKKTEVQPVKETTKKSAQGIVGEEKPTINREEFEKDVPCPKRELGEKSLLEVVEIKDLAQRKNEPNKLSAIKENQKNKLTSLDA